MEGLRKAANIVQRGLGDFADLLKVRMQRRIRRDLLVGAAKERTNRGKDLAKLVVQLPGDVPKRGFLGVNQFLRQVAALGRKLFDLGEQPAVIADEIQTSEDDGQQEHREEKVELTLHAAINLCDAAGGQFLGFIVLDQQTGDGGTEGGLARLQSVANLLACQVFIVFSLCKHAIAGIPELIECL